MAETIDEVSSAEDEVANDETAPSITELLVKVGRDVSALVFREAAVRAGKHLSAGTHSNDATQDTAESLPGT